MFDVDHFIKKFQAIPDDKMFVGNYVNQLDHTQRCALGHCGTIINGCFVDTPESEALRKLFLYNLNRVTVMDINDNPAPYLHQFEGVLPKERILNALQSLKAAQS